MLWPWMIASFFLAGTLTPLVAKFAVRVGIVDEPNGERKIHTRPVPLLGGLAVFAAVVMVTATALVVTDRLTAGLIDARHYVGFFVGGGILMIGGFLDDRFRLSPSVSFLFPVLAAFAAVAGGIEVSKLTNPFGGVLELSTWTSHIIVFVWLLVVMYVTKLLDGLDGLDTSVVVTGTVAILFLSLSATYFQPDVALFAGIATGALLGFLVWNWYQAKIFLGEGGSTFVGYLLGTLAIISGSKVAMALLVLGIPVMDLLSVVVQRLRVGWHAVVEGDRRHLHYRLLDKGWSQPRVVFFYIVVALFFSLVALALQT